MEDQQTLLFTSFEEAFWQLFSFIAWICADRYFACVKSVGRKGKTTPRMHGIITKEICSQILIFHMQASAD